MDCSSVRDFRIGVSYPFTLIFEKDSTAVPDVGRPMESAG
jgi:hypothetical protein